MSKLLLPILLIAFAFNGFSQQSISTLKVTLESNYPSQWVSYVDNQEFSIEYKFIDCDPEMGYDFQTAIFRITNKTNQKLDLSWHIDIYREGICKTCDYDFEYSRSIILDPNQVIEGDCVRNSNIQLKVFSQFNDANYTTGAKLSGFQLNNLSVESL